METFEKVKNIVVEQLGVDEEKIQAGTSFVDDLGADSLDIVELVMSLEENFGINISDEEAQNIGTVGEAVKFIESKKN